MNDYDAHLALTLAEQDEVEALRRQRDALLQACKWAKAFLDTLDLDDWPPALDWELRKAISKVEGPELTDEDLLR